MKNVLDIKLDVFEAQLVAKAMKKRFPILTVAFCKGMTARGLAYEILRESGTPHPEDERTLANEIAVTARLMEKP